MDFQISALDPEPFSHLFGLDEESLSALGAQRRIADVSPGCPCRISLEDADVGESVLLLNYEHQPADSPYRSRHAIFVREWAEKATPAVNEVPKSLRLRLLSLRAFDGAGNIVAADVVHGREVEGVIQELLANEAASYLHIHNAKPGCYAARVDRA